VIASRRNITIGACIAVAALAAACGKKGPPLAPLHPVPDAMREMKAGRGGDTVRLRFVLPTANLNGPGPIQLDRVEVYAVTAAPGALVPPNRELMAAEYRVGTIAVKPAPVEGEPPPPVVAGDTRPAPGETVEFVETLTPEKLTPAKLPLAPVIPTVAVPAPAPAGTAVPPAAAAKTAVAAKPAVAAPTYPVRIYVVRGMTKSGRGGQPTVRVQVPLVQPPAAPSDLKTGFTEAAITLAWSAPAATTPAPAPATPPAVAAAPTFNVYEGDATRPLNEKPLSAPAFERAGAQAGVEHCFSVRTVETVATIPIESAPSATSCITPKDIFPPAAPTRLSAVPTAGAMNLSWQANTDADLAGYIVLRGDAPGDRLQALMSAPITNTRYEDKTVRPGARYVYVVVAVDRATPSNTSAQSNRVEETAR
jgi:hypothetical protein